MKNALFLLICLSFVGCKKDEVTKNTFELLTNNSSKSWQLKDGLIKLDKDSQLSIISTRPVCETDNVLVLRSDRTYDLTEGPIKCGVNDPNDIVKGAAWSITDDGSLLSVDRFVFFNFTINNAVFKMTSIDENSFSGETEVEYQGQKYTGIVKFEARN